MRSGAELSGKRGERGKEEKQRGDFIKARQGQQPHHCKKQTKGKIVLFESFKSSCSSVNPVDM